MATNDIKWASTGGLKEPYPLRIQESGYTTSTNDTTGTPEFPILQWDNYWRNKVGGYVSANTDKLENLSASDVSYLFINDDASNIIGTTPIELENKITDNFIQKSDDVTFDTENNTITYSRSNYPEFDESFDHGIYYLTQEFDTKDNPEGSSYKSLSFYRDKLRSRSFDGFTSDYVNYDYTLTGRDDAYFVTRNYGKMPDYYSPTFDTPELQMGWTVNKFDVRTNRYHREYNITTKNVLETFMSDMFLPNSIVVGNKLVIINNYNPNAVASERFNTVKVAVYDLTAKKFLKTFSDTIDITANRPDFTPSFSSSSSNDVPAVSIVGSPSGRKIIFHYNASCYRDNANGIRLDADFTWIIDIDDETIVYLTDDMYLPPTSSQGNRFDNVTSKIFFDGNDKLLHLSQTVNSANQTQNYLSKYTLSDNSITQVSNEELNTMYTAKNIPTDLKMKNLAFDKINKKIYLFAYDGFSGDEGFIRLDVEDINNTAFRPFDITYQDPDFGKSEQPITGYNAAIINEQYNFNGKVSYDSGDRDFTIGSLGIENVEGNDGFLTNPVNLGYINSSFKNNSNKGNYIVYISSGNNVNLSWSPADNYPSQDQDISYNSLNHLCQMKYYNHESSFDDDFAYKCLNIYNLGGESRFLSNMATLSPNTQAFKYGNLPEELSYFRKHIVAAYTPPNTSELQASFTGYYDPVVFTDLEKLQTWILPEMDNPSTIDMELGVYNYSLQLDNTIVVPRITYRGSTDWTYYDYYGQLTFATAVDRGMSSFRVIGDRILELQYASTVTGNRFSAAADNIFISSFKVNGVERISEVKRGQTITTTLDNEVITKENYENRQLYTYYSFYKPAYATNETETTIQNLEITEYETYVINIENVQQALDAIYKALQNVQDLTYYGADEPTTFQDFVGDSFLADNRFQLESANLVAGEDFLVTHNLGIKYVKAVVYSSLDEEQIASVKLIDANSLTINVQQSGVYHIAVMR